jgi:hypothetical protein
VISVLFVYVKTRFTGVAQLVEHRSPKPRVVSSNLTARANETNDHEIRSLLHQGFIQRID